MAGKQARKAPQMFAQTEFVTCRLTDEQAAHFTEWQTKEAKHLDDDIVAFIASGHKISVTWDDANACFIVAATCKDEASDNLNKCLSSRSDNWYEALLMTMYKSEHVYGGKTWTSDTRSSSWG